jgi:hypothetical protein
LGSSADLILIGLNSKAQQFSIYLPGVSAGEADIQPSSEWIWVGLAPDDSPLLMRDRSTRKFIV